MKIIDSFYMGMIAHIGDAKIKVKWISKEKARETLRLSSSKTESYVGDADTAKLFERELQVPVKFNRCTVELEEGELVLLGQYSGPRLPEGATTLPEGAEIKWATIVALKPWD
jgi:hypothetical protein